MTITADELAEQDFAILRFMFEASFDGKKLRHAIFKLNEIMPAGLSHKETEKGVLDLANRKMLLRDNSRGPYSFGYRLSRAGVNCLAGYRDEAEAKIDSTAWTGLPNLSRFSEERRIKLVRLLSDVETALDTAAVANSEKAMARAYVVAARVLTEAPDPPSDIVWELISRANSLAGIASLLVSVIALFMAASH